MSRTRRLKVSVLCLTLVLGASWNLAAAPRETSTPARAAAIGTPWNLLTHLWGSLTSLWEQAGALADPDGKSGIRPTTDAGCSADPNGRCLTQPTTDTGATADPSGGK